MVDSKHLVDKEMLANVATSRCALFPCHHFIPLIRREDENLPHLIILSDDRAANKFVGGETARNQYRSRHFDIGTVSQTTNPE